MDTQDILIAAYKRGHAWNPEFPNLANLDLDRISKLQGDERDAKDLIVTLQQSDANFDGLVQAFHSRQPEYDGSVGPATERLVTIKRCPIPDFAPPPGASFDTGDAELNRIIKSYQDFKLQLPSAEAMGNGSWPSCDPSRPGVNSFRVNLDLTRCPTTIRNYLDKALLSVREAYAEIGCAVRYIYDGDPKECEIAKRFENLAGSVIGWNEFPSPNTCNQVISGRLDTGYAPSDYRYWANLECHETGHGVGLDHGRGHIMNPSILLVWPLSWKGSYSEKNLVKWFSGQPVPLDTDSPPSAPTTNPPITGDIFGEIKDNQIVIRGQPILNLSTNFPSGKYKYTVVPVPNQSGKFKLEQSIEV